MTTYIILAVDHLSGVESSPHLMELMRQGILYPIGPSCPAFVTKFDGTSAELETYLGKIRTASSYKKFLIAEVHDLSTVQIEDRKLDLATLRTSHTPAHL